MSYDFDCVIERRGTDSAKWGAFPEDVLPMWVADMDFASPQPIIDALARRIAHGVFGYGLEPQSLKQTLVERMLRLYRWEIRPEDILFLPGLVSGLNVVSRAIGEPGDGVLINTPVYGPFLTAPANQQRTLQSAPLRARQIGRRLHYELNMEGLAEAIQPQTKLFLLCNPHNPVGRAYTREELSEIAAFCEAHDLVICSDEIHCDLLLDDARHIPIASLAPEIAQRTITLMAPSKTFNIPGLGASFAIIQNSALRKRVEKAMAGIVPHVNILGMVAAEAAYTQCDPWLEALRSYLTANRNVAVAFIEQHLPGARFTCPEATYLLWVDLRAVVDGKPADFLLRKAKLAVNDGAWFGEGGEGFVRLNFGCPRRILEEGLQRMAAALNGFSE
ncbi:MULTISPECIES: MalY/PatB family protein [Caldilinea]|nr:MULTISPECIES: PatB family C-S lyase [Caldilinea]MBO9393378.1 PatB family C-S lyase [Caldilinea sp.]